MDAKTIILALSLIASNGISIWLYLKNKRKEKIKDLHDKLFQIQTISINYPYLEDMKFITGWLSFKSDYHNNYDMSQANKDSYLRYEQYCEMIFNLISNAYNIHSLDNEIEFKAWAKSHKDWWKNPLEEHSNSDIYGEKLSKIIDSWVE